MIEKYTTIINNNKHFYCLINFYRNFVGAWNCIIFIQLGKEREGDCHLDFAEKIVYISPPFWGFGA
jgi:hypothetical protein